MKKQTTSLPNYLWAEIWKICETQLNERKSRGGLSRNRSSTMRPTDAEFKEPFFFFLKKKKKRTEKVGNSDGSSHTLQDQNK